MIPLLTILLAPAFAEDAPAPAPTPDAPQAPPAEKPAPAPAPTPASEPAPLPGGPSAPLQEAAEASVPAKKLRRSVGVEGNWVSMDDPAWSMLSPSENRLAHGVRTRYQLRERLALQLVWLRTQAGEGDDAVRTGGVMEDEDVNLDDANVDSTLYGHFEADTVQAGARWAFFQTPKVEVYGGLAAALVLARLHLDTDPERDDPTGEISRSALTGGGVGTIGAALPFATGEQMTIAPYLEFGYAQFGDATFDDLGPVNLSGTFTRFGAEFRF